MATASCHTKVSFNACAPKAPSVTARNASSAARRTAVVLVICVRKVASRPVCPPLKWPVEARRKIEAAPQAQARLAAGSLHRHAAQRHILRAHVKISLFHGVIHQRRADVSAIDHARTCYLPGVHSAGASRLQDFVESQFSVHIPYGGSGAQRQRPRSAEHTS